jgi:hypothetical protein
MNLHTVPLGKQSAIQAIKILVSCDHFDRTTKAQVKQTLVSFVVMISEAMRFTKIRNKFNSSQQWQQQTFITEDEAKTVVHWGNLSEFLIYWKNNRRWPNTSQQYFSLRTNQPPATSQQYFSLITNQHQPSATSQTNRLSGAEEATRISVSKVLSML